MNTYEIKCRIEVDAQNSYETKGIVSDMVDNENMLGGDVLGLTIDNCEEKED